MDVLQKIEDAIGISFAGLVIGLSFYGWIEIMVMSLPRAMGR